METLGYILAWSPVILVGLCVLLDTSPSDEVGTVCAITFFLGLILIWIF